MLVQYEREVHDSKFNIPGMEAEKQEGQKWFVACAFKKVWHKQMLFLVDSDFNVLIFDVENLFSGNDAVPVMRLSLFDNCKLFNCEDHTQDLLPSEKAEQFGMSPEEIA